MYITKNCRQTNNDGFVDCDATNWHKALVPGRCDYNFKTKISEHILHIKFMSNSWEIAAVNVTEYVRWYMQVKIVSDTGLVPSIFRRAEEAQILKFNAPPPPPPTHLVCHVHLIANFLSFHMSLVVVMNCGAGNALRGFEISMFYFFLKLYLIHISKDILLLRAQNAI